MYKKLNNFQLRELYFQGKTDEEIADESGLNIDSIKRWRYRNKLLVNNTKNLVGEETFFELWENGYTDTEMGKKLNLGPKSITFWRDKNNLPSNSHLFSWQRRLKPSEFELIPEKYRNRNLMGVG